MSLTSGQNEMEVWARRLAQLNREADENIEEVIWFPHDSELRLLEVDRDLDTQDEHVIPFRFDPLPTEGIKVPISIAVVSRAEFLDRKHPQTWGGWADGRKIA